MTKRRPTPSQARANMPLAAALVGLTILTAGCAPQTAAAGGEGGSSTGGDGQTVALLLPENINPKWAKDADIFKQRLAEVAPDAKVTTYNANNSDAQQQSQVETALTAGASVIVIVAVDSTSAAQLANRAAQDNVPVIALDHQINETKNVALYVSPDGAVQGQVTGQYVADNTADGARIMFLNGSPTDNNAQLYSTGYHQVLDPLIQAGQRSSAGEEWVTGWDPQTAQKTFEQMLTAAQNQIDAVVVPWDDGSGVVATALQAQGLADKVLVTGGDATVAGLQRILLGTQTMTVLRDDREEARIGAEAAGGLLKDGKVPAELITSSVNNGAADIPAALLTPKVYDINNISELVEDGWVTKDELCSGIPAGTGPC